MIFSNLRASAWKYGCIAFATLAVVAVLTVLWFRADAIRASGERAAAVQERDSARAEVVSLKGVLDTERRKAEALTAIAQTHEDKLHEIEADSARRVADLESGNLRLRKLWAGSETQCLSETAASAAELAGQDRLRRESSERVLRAVETVQAQRDGLRAVTEADRK